VGAALTARTYGELAALVSDLPAGAPAAKPKDLVRIDCQSGSARAVTAGGWCRGACRCR
jgi:hypothetical protein